MMQRWQLWTVLILCLAADSLLAQGWEPDRALVLEGDVVTMDPAQAVVYNGRVIILGEKILYILGQDDPMPDDPRLDNALVIDTDSWLVPGLIDAHNHVVYNTLPLYDVPKKYDNRYQWNSPASYKQHVTNPKTLLTDRNYYDLEDEVIKYAEVKALVGGVTTIQGTPDRAATRFLVRNLENCNFGQDRIFQRGLTIEDSRWQHDLQDGLLRRMNDGEVDAWLVHLAEGIDTKSQQEFPLLESLGLVGDMTVVIHGTALTDDNFARMSERGTKLVWSPLSNLLLYGATTDVVSAIRKGVLVCLAPDWSPSGSKNLLDELKVVRELTLHRPAEFPADVLTDEMLVRMATVNPAFAVGFDDKVGSLIPDYYADVVAFEKISNDPYSSIVCSTEQQVRLVLIGGEPLYGDLAFMETLKPGDYEVLTLAGQQKAIDVTNPDVAKGDQTLAEIRSILGQAMLFDEEHMWEEFGGDRTFEEFQVWLEDEFEGGLVPIPLDPIYAAEDPYFFETLKNSTNASLGFDLSVYWQSGPTLSPDQAVLIFVNAQSTTVDVLDFDVRLDKRAAQNIIAHRNGSDGDFGTADDDPFDTIEELDDVTYVGASALAKLRDYVSSLNVQTDPLLTFLNDSSTTLTILDDEVGLDTRAAESIIAHRDGPDGVPGSADDDLFDSIDELDQVRWVGATAISRLRDYVSKQ